jgi:hypothetical protein
MAFNRCPENPTAELQNWEPKRGSMRLYGVNIEKQEKQEKLDRKA